LEIKELKLMSCKYNHHTVILGLVPRISGSQRKLKGARKSQAYVRGTLAERNGMNSRPRGNDILRQDTKIPQPYVAGTVSKMEGRQ